MTKPYARVMLNNGNVEVTEATDADQSVIDELLPMVDAGSGDFPEVGLGFDIVPPKDAAGLIPGAAYFQIASTSGMVLDPYFMYVGCWRSDRSGEAWRKVLEIHEALGTGRPAPRMPKAPWLAVAATPAAQGAGLTLRKLTMIQRMEKCLFRSLAEGN